MSNESSNNGDDRPSIGTTFSALAAIAAILAMLLAFAFGIAALIKWVT